MNTPSPPPQPGEQGITRRSNTAPRLPTGGRTTRSSTRAGDTNILATPITPSRKITARVRSPAKALDGVAANSYSILGDDEATGADTTTVPSPPTGGQQTMAHGWDAFVNSLTPNDKVELGAIDEILVSYANFAGGAFRTFEAESDRIMHRILAMEEEWDHDRDEMIQTRGTLTKLEELVLANAQGICDLRVMMRENVTTVATLQRTVDETSHQVKHMTDTLREVTETATTALQMASRAEPTITGQGIRIDALIDDVSKMTSDIDGLRESNKLALLEGTITRVDAEVDAIRKLITSTVPDGSGDNRSLPTEDTTISPAGVHLAQQGADMGTDVGVAPHPLFPHADPIYRTARGPPGTDDTPSDDPLAAAHGTRPPPVDTQRSPFRQDQPPRNHYMANPSASTIRLGTRTQLDATRRSGYMGPAGPADDDDESLGGVIVSPRNADRRRQALALRISPFDIARLGNVRYHGGTNGYQPLTEGIIHRCGYKEINSADVILSYNDIIEIHSRTCDNWEHPRGLYKGPQLERILEKGLASFPRLSTIAVEPTVEFYDAFTKTAVIYLLPVMPFDCISIKMGFEALCPPGLGIPRYAAIARVLMELLPRLLPRSDTQVSSLINMVRMESGNGYDLLWRIMALSVPGFNPAMQVKIPVWHDDDIFDYALSFLLYFRLQAKKGVVQDDRTQSMAFLQAISEPAYADAITTLTTCITNYEAGLDDGYLPANLCIMGLATQLHSNTRTRAHAVLPAVRRTLGMVVQDRARDDISQGYPRVTRLAEERATYRDGRAVRRDTRHGSSRPSVQGSGGTGRMGRPPRGRFARPDRNDGVYRPDIICDACRRTGHVAANCDVLAIALFLEKYKRELTDEAKDKIETNWVDRWRSVLGTQQKKPRRVMKTYLDLLDISVDELDDQMCWDCWPDGDDDEDAIDDPSE